MAGCYGSSAEDRYWERRLDEYLDSQVDADDVYGDEVSGKIDEEIASGHYLFCEFLADLPEERGAPEEILEDWALLHGWYKSLGEDERKRIDEEYHEYRHDDVMDAVIEEHDKYRLYDTE